MPGATLHVEIDDARVRAALDRLKEAGTHQFGASKGAFGTTSRGSPIPWGDIPARPFFGLSSEDEWGVLEILTDHLIDAIR